MNTYNTIIRACGSIFAVIVAYLGGWDLALEILIFMVVVDYATGVLKGLYERKLSSKIGAKGIIKKIALFVIVAVAFQIDRLFGTHDVMRTAAIGLYIANEGLSILENIASMGNSIPKPLKDLFLQLREKHEKSDK